MLAQVVQQARHRRLQRRFAPVIAAAVAECIRAQQAQRVRIATVVALPVFRVGEHHPLEHLDQLRAVGFRQQFVLDHRQREQGFAIGERRRRANLEDGEMVAYQGVQAGFGLVVGGMRLEHDARLVFDEIRERSGGGRIVVLHRAVVEIHAGLHHHRHHPLPGVLQVGRIEGLTVDLKRACRSLRRGHLHAAAQRAFATRDRHFGADHVHRHRQAGVARRGFGDAREFRRTCGDGFVRQRRGIVRAGHAAVEMDLVEAGGHVGADQLACMRHRDLGGLLLPRIRAEVIAAQDQAFARERLCIGQREQVVAELRRRHPRVSAELVDLVGGRFDQQRGVVVHRHLHGGQQHLLVAAAHAVQADVVTRAVGSEQCLHDGHGGTPE